MVRENRLSPPVATGRGWSGVPSPVSMAALYQPGVPVAGRYPQSVLRPGSWRHVVGPRLHELAALGEQVAAPVGGLGLVLDRMGEGHFDHLARKVRLLGRPIPEARPETVRV